MPTKYQMISADNTEDMQRYVVAMEAQGYVPVGSLICGTRKETVEHTIKGATIVLKTYLKQSFWYAPNADSAFEDCIKQHDLLTQVVENANEPITHYMGRSVLPPEYVEIDRDIIDVIEAHLRGDAE